MIKNGIGGGNTITGLNFEKETDLLLILSKLNGYKIENLKTTNGGLVTNANIYFDDKIVARCFKKAGFYKLLEEQGINYKTLISKRLEPDQALYVIVNNTLL
jgi:hypothetical protein